MERVPEGGGGSQGEGRWECQRSSWLEVEVMEMKELGDLVAAGSGIDRIAPRTSSRNGRWWR
jgi:hypothetical protein